MTRNSDIMSEKEIKSAKIEDMANGWFIGDFEPSLFKTPVMEVAVKFFKAGEKIEEHYHKLATVFTVIVEGEAEICGKRYKKGDIVIVEPKIKEDFIAVTDVAVTVVKVPGVKNDKYFD